MNNSEASISVSALNAYVKQMFERDDFLSGVSVCGEISNFKRNSSGHIYFSLKDEGAAVSAVMFRGAASSLSFLPSDGMRVTVYGRLSVYEKTGQYQIYVQAMRSDGKGELMRAYEALKAKLAYEGLFAPERKKPIPQYPKKIGIITSPTGAAVRDMLNVTRRRYPLADILIVPSAVQGAEAPSQLLFGVEILNHLKNTDVIIIGRGGGSIEDLWAFNDEALVRAVAASEIPIISAVGHETDFTLCDFAADMRAPTPSAAAELAVPDASGIYSALEYKLGNISERSRGILSSRKDMLVRAEKIISLNSPTAKLERSVLMLDNVYNRINASLNSTLSASKATLAELSARLAGMNPLAVLSRGYAAIEDSEGKIISSVSSMNEGGQITLVMADGQAKATVDKIMKKEDSRI